MGSTLSGGEYRGLSLFNYPGRPLDGQDMSRSNILIVILGILLLASGIFLATTKFRSGSDNSGSVTVSSVIKATDPAKLNEEPKKETAKKDKDQGEVSGVTDTNIAQLSPQQNQSPSNNSSQTQPTQQPKPNQNPTYQFNFKLPPSESNSPSEEYCNSEKSYLDSTYQSDVSAENRDYERRREQLREYYASRGTLQSGFAQRALGQLAVEHNARLDKLKREYDRNVANLVNEGCNF